MKKYISAELKITEINIADILALSSDQHQLGDGEIGVEDPY